MARLDRLVRQVAADAAVELPVEVAVASLAGADYPEDVDLLRERIERLGLASDVVVVNDTIGAFHAGASETWGVALVCGKGINAAAISPDWTRGAISRRGRYSRRLGRRWRSWPGGAAGGRTRARMVAAREPRSSRRFRPTSTCQIPMP
jgi:hypothetical protein